MPHRRYYGEEPAEIATAAAEEYWRTGLGRHPELPLPAWACEVTIDDVRELVERARELMPDVGIQVPPNLSDWWPELVAAGASDLGGLSANGDHISPEHPFPSPHQVRRRLAATASRSVRAPVRVPALHRPGVGRAGRARRDRRALLVVHPAPRLGAARGAGDPPRPRGGGDRARGARASR